MTKIIFGITRSPSRLIALCTTIAAVFLYLTPAPQGVPASAITGSALCLFAVGLYATVAIPEFLTAIMFFTLAMLIGIGDANVVFSGFHSTAFWMVFGGMIIGVAVQKTGLGVRLATIITSRFSGSYSQLICGVSLVGVALSFVMPSTMGRVVLLIPIVVALCDELGYEQGSVERSGLILAVSYATWMPSMAILPANVPNMVLAGVSENLFGIIFTYGDYMLTHMPVNGILKVAAIIGLVFLLFPTRHSDSFRKISRHEQKPLSADGHKLAVILTITLGFWATDFLHHISPAWVAMSAAVVCLWPGFGLVDGKDLTTKVNFPSAVYVAGILSLGALLVKTGAGDWVGGWLLAHLPLSKESPFLSFYSMVGLGVVVNMASTAPSVPAVVGPLASEISNLSGIPLKTVLMSQVIAYSSVVLPYQAPPLIVALGLGGVPLRDGAKMTAALAAITLIALVPLNFLWWSWLGMMH